MKNTKAYANPNPKAPVKLGKARRVTQASFDGNRSELIGDKLTWVGG